MTECCQALSAPLPDMAVAPAAQLFVLQPTWDVMEPLQPPRVVVPAPGESAIHGPPGAFTFVELVLQRSLLAHAPPFVVA